MNSIRLQSYALLFLLLPLSIKSYCQEIPMPYHDTLPDLFSASQKLADKDKEGANNYFSSAASAYYLSGNYHDYWLAKFQLALLDGNEEDKSEILQEIWQQSQKYSLSSNFKAELWYNLADKLYELNAFASSKSIFISLMPELIRNLDSKYQVKVYNNLGLCYWQDADFDSTIYFFNKALTLATAFGKDNLPVICLNLAQIYSYLGKYQISQLYLDSSLIHQNKNAGIDPAYLPYYYENLGNLYLNSGNREQSMFHLKKVLVLSKKDTVKYTNMLARIYLSLGRNYAGLSDLEKAIEYYQYALNFISIDSNRQSTMTEAVLLINIGSIYFRQQKYSTALNYFYKALSFKIVYNLFSSNDKTYSSIAGCYAAMNNFTKADEFHQKAIAQSSAFQPINYLTLAEAHIAYGSFLFTNKQFESAEKHFLTADQLLSKNVPEKHYSYLRNDYLLASVNYEKGNFNKALELIKRAKMTNQNKLAGSVQPGQGSLTDDFYSPVIQVYLLMLESDTYSGMSKKKNDKGLLKKAYAAIDKCIRITNNMGSQFSTQESQLQWSKDRDNVYSKAVTIALNLFEATHDKQYLKKSFMFTEKNKSFALLSNLNGMEGKIRSNIPEEKLKEEAQLTESIGFYEDQIYQESQKQHSDENKIRIWQQKLFGFKRQLDDIHLYYKNNFSEYYHIKYNSEVFSSQAVMDKLRSDELVLEYQIIENELLIYAITKSQIKYKRIAIDESLNKTVIAYREFLSVNPGNMLLSQYFQDFSELSSTLYKLLIAPVSGLLKGKKLIIIPDEILAYVPFETLIPLPKPGTKADFRKLPYLIRQHEIGYSYSATLYFRESARKQIRSNSVLAIAPVYKGFSTISRNLPYTTRSETDNLLPLLSSIDEVKGISKYFRTKKYMNSEATERNFKQLAPHYNILHLAMHTLYDNKNPMQTKLIFYPVRDTSEDGLLNAFELYNQELHANLAVLSACNTGNGTLSKGEGIMSLARAFLYAGCPSVVMTLWTINDHSSAKVITLFYKYLHRHYSKTQALRQAKLDYLSEAGSLEATPYFWSAYLCIGNNQPLTMRFVEPKLTILLIVIMALVISFIVYKKLIKK